MSETQWPTLPLPDEAGSDTEPGTARYMVLIEEQEARGNGFRPIMKRGAGGRVWSSRAEAQRQAEQVARSHEPRHPSSLQARGSFRLSDDEYLTIVEGAMLTFHFRTLVAEVL